MNAKSPSTPAVARPFPVTPLAAWLLPAAGVRRGVLGAALAAAFAALTVVGANVVIPIEPVPITLQTLFVLLAGAAIGPRWGSLSQLLYVGLGLFGLPLYAGGAHGLAVLTGPTGGYLLSFLVAPLVVASMLRRSHRLGWQVLSFLTGKLVILTLGVVHLALFYTHDLAQAITVGVVPFLPGAVFKIAAAVSIHRSSQALVRHYHPRSR
jgi:biotin transport system substrate-specific component